MSSQLAFAFDRFVLDPVAGRLYGRSGALPLTPKACALLEYLASNAGRLLTKRELLDALWPRAYVTDGVLKVCIREIRRALDDDARSPRIIETAHRRGYRFIALVETVVPMDRLRLVDPIWICGAAHQTGARVAH
jgi:DNA-binding winged helix-turn-helix (wHTH) protein